MNEEKTNTEFIIESENFQGPLDKLLELVKKEKLNINQISLAEVTGNFLEYLTELKKDKKTSYSVLADFLVVASKLLLIKSKVLIPSLELEKEEEEDIYNLEVQLKIYSQIKEAEKKIEENWHKYPTMAEREFLTNREAIFFPGNISVKKLKESLISITEEIKKIKPVEKVKREVVNLKNKMEEVMKKISNQPTGLKSFFQKGTKNEVVILFLVVLHLFRDEKIYFEQNKRFGDIKIKKAEK
ncbi:MAG: segregation/condensation protein A [Desulfosalsimonadaceae bacterium]